MTAWDSMIANLSTQMNPPNNIFTFNPFISYAAVLSTRNLEAK